MRPTGEPGPLQTFTLMLTALGILFLGGSVFAYAWGGRSLWSLNAVDVDSPAEFLRELRHEGMNCQPRAERPEMYDCIYRQPGHPAGGEPHAAIGPGPFALASR